MRRLFSVIGISVIGLCVVPSAAAQSLTVTSLGVQDAYSEVLTERPREFRWSEYKRQMELSLRAGRRWRDKVESVSVQLIARIIRDEEMIAADTSRAVTVESDEWYATRQKSIEITGDLDEFAPGGPHFPSSEWFPVDHYSPRGITGGFEEVPEKLVEHIDKAGGKGAVVVYAAFTDRALNATGATVASNVEVFVMKRL